MLHSLVNIGTLVLGNALFAAASIDMAELRSFSDALTAELYSQDNECSSTLGVSMAFSLIYPGSTGNSTIQIRDVMGYPSGDKFQLVWDDISTRLDDNYQGACPAFYNNECEEQEPTLEIAYSVWFDDNATLAPAYAAVVGDYAIQTDFEAADSPIIMNEWVENQTNGLIDEIVPEDRPLYPPYVLIAINSIYLKASWQEPFMEVKTNQDVFYGSASRTTQVSQAYFMHHVYDYTRYSHDALPGYQMLQLPFTASTLSMIFVLPMADNVGLTTTSTEVVEVLGDLEYTRLAVGLPKFKFERKYEDEMKGALQSIGIEQPFNGKLCDLFGYCGLYIDKVIQKTVIDVNEEGVEAAAVTAVFVLDSAGPSEDPTLVLMDHPFQFFIYDSTEDVVLFEGRLGAPDIPSDADPVKLQSQHSDDDFWSSNFFVNPETPTYGTYFLSLMFAILHMDRR